MSVPSIRPKLEPRKRDRRNGNSWKKLQDGLRNAPSWGGPELLTHAEIGRQRERREGHGRQRLAQHRSRNRLIAGLAVLVVVTVGLLVLLFG